MLIEEVNRWEKLARAGFTYKADNAKITDEDKWRSHAEAALAGLPWEGDCADLASTVLDLCGQAGMPLADRYFLVLYADPGDGKLVGHATGCITTDDGQFWIVGDTFEDAPYLAVEMKHFPVDYHRQSEVTMVNDQPIFQWRKGIPWKIED